MSKNATAVIYARVSTVKQADEGLPIESQIEQCKAKAESLGAVAIKVFTDAGISGRTDERPAFQDAIAYCKVFGVDYFVCWSSSRLARNKIDAAKYKKELANAGTRVVYVSMDVDTSTDSGWMMDSMLEMMDELYSRQVRTDTIRSMIKNARDGHFNGGRYPFGYKTEAHGKRKRLVIDETEASVVKRIFSYYLQGYGTKNIALQLNAEGMLYRGRPWSKNTINLLLKNETYLGRTIFNRTRHGSKAIRPRDQWVISQSHEAIIDEGDFMMVQSLFAERSPTEGAGSPLSNFMFTGMLMCGKCKSTLQIESATGRNATYHYYNCRRAQKGLGCEPRRLPAEALDKFLLDAIMDRILTREALRETLVEIRQLSSDWIQQRANRRDILNKSLRAVESRLRNLYDVLELHGQNAPNLSDLTFRIRELRAQKDKIDIDLLKLEQEQQPEVLISETDIDQMAEIIKQLMATASDVKRVRMVLSSFVQRVVIDQNQAHLHYSRQKVMNHALGVVHSDAIWLPDLGSNQGHTD